MKIGEAAGSYFKIMFQNNGIDWTHITERRYLNLLRDYIPKINTKAQD
jgi:hypothetical protein